MAETTLIYVGGGFLPGVPARDLSADEVEQYGGQKALIKSGLYRPATRAAAKPAAEKEK